MRVLITGANGQVGRALAQAAPKGVELRALAHTELDISDRRSVAGWIEQFRPDAIINAAAYTAVDQAEAEPELAARVNAEGPGVLAQAAQRSGKCRLVHVSTDFVFDGQGALPYRPDADTRPLSVYGRTKLDGERRVLETLRENAIVVRTAWVYAATGKNFLRTMLRLMTEKGSVRVVSDQVGTPTAAHSVAGALWAIVARPDVAGVFHWTDAGVASWYDFAVAIAEEGATRGLLPANVRVTPIATEDYPLPARRPAYSVLDQRATASTLGITPVHWRINLRLVMGEIGGG